MASQTIKVSVLADTTRFKRAMSDLGDVSGINKLGSGIAAVGRQILNLTKWASAGMVALGAVSTKAASQLEQNMGTIDDIFKDTAGKVHEFAYNAAKDVGLSRNSYYELASVISTQLKNGGTSMDKLAGKSNDLIKVGADLAAGFGGSTADAVNAISSALKGERDPIEKYGISLNQAAVDAKAAELGFKKVGGSLSLEANQAATLALIMEQSSDMHGKFGRETDTLAHKQQVLKAQLENAAATLGSYLIPAASAVVGWFSDHLQPALGALQNWIDETVIPAIERLSDQFRAALPTIEEIAGAIGSRLVNGFKAAGDFITGTLIPAVSATVRWIGENKNLVIGLATVVGSAALAWKGFKIAMAGIEAGKAALGALTSAVKYAKGVFTAFKATTEGMTAAQKALNAAQRANLIGVIVTAVVALITFLVILYQKNETFRNAVQTAWQAIQSAVSAVVSWFQTYVQPVLSSVFSIISSAVSLAWTIIQTVFNLITTTVSNAVTVIMAVLSPVFGFFQGLFSGIWNVIQFYWSTAWNVVTTLLGAAWSTISGILSTLADFIKGVVGTIKAVLSGDFSGAWQIAKDTVSNAWNAIKNGVSNGISALGSLISGLPGKILGWLGNLGSLLWDAGSSIIDGFIDGIMSGFNTVKNKLQELTSWLPAWKGPAPVDRVILKKSGQLVIGGFVDGLRSQFGSVRQTLGSLTGELPGMISADGSLTLATTPGAPAGAVYNITVQALAATPEIGRLVVKAIKEYDDSNGRRR